MCGIFAVLSPKEKIYAENLSDAVQTLKGRGPDSEGVWINDTGKIGFAHTRLRVIDLASGNQPLHSKNGTIHAIINGEFYDFERQRKELEREGFEFQTKTDSEIIIPLYQKYGIDAVHYLRGEFAFAVWDENTQTLFAGRDRFGIKPLFYAEFDNKLYLASEAKTLFAVGVPFEWDEESVFQQMYFYPNQDRTLFSRIRQLPAGCLLLAKNGNLRIERYWDLDYPSEKIESESAENKISGDERELTRQLRDEIDEAVRLRLRADVEVAAFLSGGIDSSAILGIAAKHYPKKIKAFTIGFEEEGFDETEIAKETSQFAKAEFNPVKVSFADIAENLRMAVTQAETFGVNWHGVARYILSRAVKDNGIKVALTGEGADEIFAGYIQFKQDFEQIGNPENDPKIKHFESVFKKLGFVPAWMRKISLGRAAFDLFLTKEFAEKFKSYDLYENFLKQFDVQLAGRDYLRQSQYLWTRSILPNYTLFAERLEAGNGVETRVPFLDHKLFEFTRKIPANLLIHEMQEKYILREAVRPVLTERVYKRAKHPFLAPSPLSDKHNPMFEIINDTLRGKAAEDVPFLDQKVIVAVLDRFSDLPRTTQTSLDSVLAMLVCACFLQEEFKTWNKFENAKTIRRGAK